jgi:hypothetical protein
MLLRRRPLRRMPLLHKRRRRMLLRQRPQPKKQQWHYRSARRCRICRLTALQRRSVERPISTVAVSTTSPVLKETISSISFRQRREHLPKGAIERNQPGDRTMRTMIGFDLGASQVRTHVQVFQRARPDMRLVAEAETSRQSNMNPAWGDVGWARQPADSRSLERSAAPRRLPMKPFSPLCNKTPSGRRRKLPRESLVTTRRKDGCTSQVRD